MRSRRSDGLWIVFLGLLAFTVAVSALPAPDADLGTIVAHNQKAVVNTDLTTGKQLADQKVTSLKINPKFDPALFQAPERK